MIELLHLAQGIIERGLIFGIIVASVYLASQLINFDNLAVEGAFGLGGAVTAILISFGINPWLTLLSATVVGAGSGILTGLLHTKLKLNNLISGIVITTALFSLSLKIAGSTMALTGKSTIFSVTPFIYVSYNSLIVLLVFCFLLWYFIKWFLKSEVGLLLHTVGDAPQVITNLGKNVNVYIIMGLMFSNMLAALSGSLFVQYTGYFSIWTSVGILIIGLAGMILAQLISVNFGWALLIGSIMYQAIIAFTFELQLDQDWNKLVTALLIVLLVTIKPLINKEKENNVKIR